MHLRLSPDAIIDLEEIQEYLAPKNSQGLQRIMTSIFASFDQMEAFPLLGRQCEVEDTKELTVPRTQYRIIYTLPDAYNIDVERVLHAKLEYPLENK